VLFPTATFAIFFLLVLPLSWLTMPSPHRWRPFIVAASYVFYSWWDWHFIFLLAASTLWNHVLAVSIHRSRVESRRKLFLVLALAGNVGVLGYFKYYDFFVSSTDNLLSVVHLDLPLGLRTIVLPVGVSFYTFMAISYIVDTYRGDFVPVTFEKFATYLSFFPHLVAGPIVRAGELIPQFETPRDPGAVDTSRAFYLIATGLFKKVVIANYLAGAIVDDVFGAPGQHSSLELLIAIYAYAVQIYADFSGYTDIAIGIALLLGFKFPQNFDSPYAAVSIQDFWRRWHMTLSRWLRDYVYIPLGGNRKGPRRTYVNLLLTMLIGGLWHGAAWTFVVWGGLHGAFLAAGRLRRGPDEEPPTGLVLWRRRIVTFHLVCLAWVFVRADSFGTAKDVLVGLFTRWGHASPLVTFAVVAAIVVGIASQYLPHSWPRGLMERFSRLPVVAQAAVLGLGLMVTSVMGPEGVAPFIYFRF
jgi:D-alanyl-lipoteichoic acid acyltransferase DltB (MBOAT superfamily)